MTVLDTPLDVDGEGGLSELDRKVQRELEYDKGLDYVADKIAEVVVTAIKTDRAEKFWDMAGMLLPYQRRVRDKPDDLARYEALQKVLENVIAKVNERLCHTAGRRKKSYKVPYLLKHIRVRERFRRDQMLRGIPYPYYHELVQDFLTPADREAFLERIERGEIRSTSALRDLVEARNPERLPGSSSPPEDLGSDQPS